MNPRASNNRNAGLTLTEVLVVLAIIAVLVAMLLVGSPDLNASDRARTISCMNNLKEIDLAYVLWGHDNNGRFPFEISVKNGGTMELVEKGDIVSTFQINSNYLATPKILCCPADSDHVSATNFSSDLSVKNISYFIGVDAKERSPNSILAGDDNIEISGIPIKSGLITVPANAQIGWTSSRHKVGKTKWTLSPQKLVGNINFSGGPACDLDSSDLAANFTNNITRLAIP
jgi:prepilin-type N-terminal cleavage/methylation domain-containing protein